MEYAASIIRKAILVIVSATLFAGIVLGAQADQAAASTVPQIRSIDVFRYEIAGGSHGTINLPHSFENLAPRTAVTLYADVESKPQESLLVKTVYALLKHHFRCNTVACPPTCIS